jgi:methyltransferase (TIGR00027 family)
VTLARAHLTSAGIVDDPYAERFLPSNLRWALSVLRFPGLASLGRNPSFAYLAGRTLFYDEFVRNALDAGVRQVVVLAAGYDRRAWRMARPGVTYFEVDLPATQADKRSRAPESGTVYVPADVTDPGLADKLGAAGFVQGERAAFIAEGLTMYLTEVQVIRLLRTLAGLGEAEGRLAVNFGVGFEQQGSNRGRIGRRVMAAGGESFRFRLLPAAAPDFLAKTGWTMQRVLTGPELRDKYLSGTQLERVKVTTTGFAVEATAP